MLPKTIHKRRLLKLARHLLHGELAHEVFDFTCWNKGIDWDIVKKHKGNVCGTNGCAIGECPRVFPRFFKWNHTEVEMRKGDDYRENWHVSLQYDFFGLSQPEFDALFIPECAWSGDPNNSRRLPSNATRYDVAKNIISFCKKKYGKIRLTRDDVAKLALATLC
jgi:hypothetical protein